MRLSRKSDYALRAVKHLATLPKGKLGSINSIAEAELIPREFLAKILKDLTMSGILVSYQGVKGGYRLDSLPKDISFLNVMEAIDGPMHLNLCTEEGENRCKNSKDCPMKPFWENQEALFKKALTKEHFGKYKNAKKSSAKKGKK